MKHTQKDNNTNKNPGVAPKRCPAHIRIGTRGSALAVAQAMEVKNRLLGAFPDELTQSQIEIVKIMTTGDRIQDRHLADIGGKGLFTKEIEEALFKGAIDMAVHSMKDMPDKLPPGLIIDCIIEREDPRDAFISKNAKNLMDLKKGAVVGTSSMRRQSQILKLRPDLKIVQFRGNVITRLEKLARGDVDATILAAAGLKRIGMEEKITAIIPTDVMLPAVAQGAIGVECLEQNEHILRVLDEINHEESRIQVTAEREFLKVLEGSCSTPIGGLAELRSGKLYFKGMVASPDGSEMHFTKKEGRPEDAEKIGREAGEEMLQKGGALLAKA